MNWATLYITGRKDFREDVRRRLESSKLDFMPGYIDGSFGKGNHDLYWLNENVPLRKFKEAVGGKLIWKYRLRFYTNSDEFLASINNTVEVDELTQDEEDFLTTMRKSA